eukprot:TRINITY_DN4861_c1_g2_i1.p1 TRINITY_DN4861_c1_g2~~TRINITY_DN4861_c1_g2_i1.p1  ORF type:complete len:561 (+),score=100.88 TRINITY_DN4861_c1_g2_i1:163-1845(+)
MLSFLSGASDVEADDSSATLDLVDSHLHSDGTDGRSATPALSQQSIDQLGSSEITEEAKEKRENVLFANPLFPSSSNSRERDEVAVTNTESSPARLQQQQRQRLGQQQETSESERSKSVPESVWDSLDRRPSLKARPVSPYKPAPNSSPTIPNNDTTVLTDAMFSGSSLEHHRFFDSASYNSFLQSGGRIVSKTPEGDRPATPPVGDNGAASASRTSPSTPGRYYGDNFQGNPRHRRLDEVLNSANVDLDGLKKAAWHGIPWEVRPTAWMFLMGYLPTNGERREGVLERKRTEYKGYVEQYFSAQEGKMDEYESDLLKQIRRDVPRTNPNFKLFQQEVVQKCMERILFLWAIRHPASGYVQGINDLITPFFVVYLSQHVGFDEVEGYNVSEMAADTLQTVEADTFWCTTKLLDNIQDHYTDDWPGVQRMLFKLEELVSRIEPPLANHLADNNTPYFDFAFRWMSCLLMREVPLPLIIRMWDTYLAEGPQAFSVYHVYVCLQFLLTWKGELLQRDCENLMMFLQNCPTQKWGMKEIELLLSDAYKWKLLYQESPSHFHQKQ